MAAVALMDAKSIATTATNGEKLTSAETLECWGYQKADPEKEL